MKRRVIALVGAAALVVVSAPVPGPVFVERTASATTTSKDCSRTSVGFTPLTEMKGDLYKGYKGGLYPKAKNKPPKKYRNIGAKKAKKVRPRSPDGTPAADGKIVFVSIGMSNTKGEFGVFEDLAAADGSLNDSLLIINGARGGQDAEKIRHADAPYWTRVTKKVRGRGGTEEQVQAVWLKQAIARPEETFPDDAKRLQSALSDIVDILRDRFKNLRLVYISSRIYAGYATKRLNPEPYAYQGGFSVKWLIGKQVRTAPRARPWLAWGPYLWADGMVGREDGLVWKCGNLADDGTHPSESGKRKVARRLLRFMKTQSTTKSWFLE